MRDCIKRLNETVGLSAAEAKRMLGDAERAAKRKAQKEGIEYEDALESVLNERLDNVERNIKRQKEILAKNLLLKQRAVDNLQTFIDSGLSIKDAVRAMLEGIESPIKGARNSIDAQKNAVKSMYLSELAGKLTRENLMTIFSEGSLSDELGEALWDISLKKEPTGKNQHANKIAKIVHEVRDAIRKRSIKAGADIGETAGFVMSQRHDIPAMLKAGKAQWISDMKEWLNPERTFDGEYDDFDKALSSGYDAQVSGKRLDDFFEAEKKSAQFYGPANLAKRISEQRLYHFKDYKSWKAWNEKYGMRSLSEGIVESIAYSASNLALLERFGTSPELTVISAAEKIMENNRNLLRAGDGTQNKIEQMITGMMEKQKIPASSTLASIGSNIRAYQNIIKLGGTLLSSVTDIPLTALEYSFQGKNYLSAMSKSIMDVAYGFKTEKERVEFASLTGVYIESVLGNIGGVYDANENFSGRMAKLERLFFRLNGLTWWTDSRKAAFTHAMAHELGLKAGLKFDELDVDTKRLFGNYDIEPADWDAMRATVHTLEEDGRNYILAEFIPDKKVAQKLVTYILDRQRAAVISKGAREERIATLGNLQRGTVAGEFVRFVMQFKTFPITVATKVVNRAIYGKGRPDVPAIVQLMLYTMVFGYLSDALHGIVKNKTPKDPTKIETVYASLARGGGLGILGDLLFQEYTFGKSFSSVLAGPTLGTLDQIFKIYSAGARGGGSQRELTMFAINSIPFNNLFYTRAALDQLILLEMQDQMNPGYLRRMERNMEKTYGQELIFK